MLTTTTRQWQTYKSDIYLSSKQGRLYRKGKANSVVIDVPISPESTDRQTDRNKLNKVITINDAKTF